MSDRNTEIWSTRLQREILALESSDDESKKIELLPPFITTVGHTLNIEGGIAKIEFRIDVEVGEENTVNDDSGEAADSKGDERADDAQKDDKGDKKEKDVNEMENCVDAGGDANRDVEAEVVPNLVDGDRKELAGVDAESENATNATENQEQPTDQTVGEGAADHEQHVILVLDASLYWKPDPSGAQSTPTCYPFQKPLAIVKSGSHLFKGGSTIRNGDELDIDLDWTPSIHLSDAVTNVALKIRECVRRGEPLYPSKRNDDDEGEELLSETLKREARESIMETKKAMGAMFSSLTAKGSSFASKGQSMKGFLSSTLGESMASLAESESVAKQKEGDTKNMEREAKEDKKTLTAPKISSFASKGQSMKGFFSSTLGETLSALSEPTNNAKQSKPVSQAESITNKVEGKSEVTKGLPNIGDVIDLSEEPWNVCVGMYSCKAIKRPAFVEAAITEAAKKQKKEKDVPNSSFGTAGAMFSRFAQSAKSAMEETFLMITEDYIIEFKSNRLNIGSGTVTFAIKIGNMAKLKFRREESLSLFFKQANDDPLVYMCLDSAPAVQDIQKVLKRHGVKGKHTNAATQKAIQMALNMVHLIQQKEKELLDNPTVENVNDIMDLYRQAAEKFESAGDPRHAEVMAHMKRFLNQQFTVSILDGSFKREHAVVKNNSPALDESKVASSVPQGEILEQPTYNALYDEDEDDDDDHHTEIAEASTSSQDNADTEKVAITFQSPSKKKNEETMKNVDDILEEAKRDMEDFGIGNDDIDNILNSPPRQTASDDVEDTFAELDAMLSDADKELNDLLNS
mmetsp:Transcript_23046/g.48686  ORF Transcript_23046/g.48686 Transcript_23046/m.48686 type:complete len:802 (+) Transcript_23046:169-2574(+)|eukprot:CAMPEP_0171343316 /NCGR_PEP_ID=MMETSP0878-20121228/16828_1 /TAXON_ID=67004 /ORGANISM="Thalassiosira weissflogii, Strain CCMP1336" /LENGTH=801 /DNA_ID=CAMNT_0011846241 /DNA_START=106 /DNA_END=2511 /DNA_ORIENTATION=+